MRCCVALLLLVGCEEDPIAVRDLSMPAADLAMPAALDLREPTLPGGRCAPFDTLGECAECCAEAHPLGATFAADHLYPCLCTACLADCDGSEVCEGPNTPSEACLSCRTDAITGACSAETAMCVSDLQCRRFFLCINDCLEN